MKQEMQQLMTLWKKLCSIVKQLAWTTVLRYYQSQLVEGRPLEIADPSLGTQGMTNQIFVDRLNLLETALDEIKDLDNKRVTLEVQFYNEVKHKLLFLKPVKGGVEQYSLCLSKDIKRLSELIS